MENKGKYLGIVAILTITIVVVYAGLGNVEKNIEKTVSFPNATSSLKGANYVADNYIANVTMWTVVRSCTIFANDTHEVIICE